MRQLQVKFTELFSSIDLKQIEKFLLKVYEYMITKTELKKLSCVTSVIGFWPHG